MECVCEIRFKLQRIILNVSLRMENEILKNDNKSVSREIE